MNIFIVGPMGSGKSTVGKIISSELFLNFFDTDEEIETRTGASIDWIFDLEGEEGFRKRESNILEEMVQQNSIVLSTGGGIILSESNRYLYHKGLDAQTRLDKGNTIICCLTATLPFIMVQKTSLSRYPYNTAL